MVKTPAPSHEPRKATTGFFWEDVVGFFACAGVGLGGLAAGRQPDSLRLCSERENCHPVLSW